MDTSMVGAVGKVRCNWVISDSTCSLTVRERRGGLGLEKEVLLQSLWAAPKCGQIFNHTKVYLFMPLSYSSEVFNHRIILIFFISMAFSCKIFKFLA
jgi:hypothetical protein